MLPEQVLKWMTWVTWVTTGTGMGGGAADDNVVDADFEVVDEEEEK